MYNNKLGNTAKCLLPCMHARTHTHTVLWPFVWDYSGELGRYQKKHLPTHTYPDQPTTLYQLPPSTTIYSILPVEFTCLTVFLHNPSPSPLWSTSWFGTSTSYSINFFTQSMSSFRNTCPYHCSLLCITSSNPSLSLSSLYLELLR